ncbi:MAG: carboxypeptidase-like regulatory domain-containing protein [Nocardioidaceae bacterium]
MSDQILSDLLDRAVERVPVSPPPLADLLRHGHAARGRRRRRAVLGTAVASLLVAVGAVAVGQQARNDGPPPVDQAPTVPTPPTGMKWVGVGRTVVAVPQAWPVVPGIYCQGPSTPFVTITQWRVAVGCPPLPEGSSPDQASVDIEGSPTGELRARLSGSAAGLTQRSLDTSRITLASGWLTVPSGEPAGGAGLPTLTSQIAALDAAGFHVVRKRAAPLGKWRPVTTDPEVGTPVRRGSSIVVYDHGPVASSATLTGRLEWVGGPAPGRADPHAGIVHIVSSDGTIDQTVAADDRGRWKAYLPPGTYSVLATSPGYGTKKGSPDACSAQQAVNVGAGESVTVNVHCQRK